MKISEIILFALAILLIGAGFLGSDGHPSVLLGIITWPIAGILLLTVILRRLIAGSLTKTFLLIVVCYLAVGILFSIWRSISSIGGYSGDTFANFLIENLIGWPVLLIFYFL